MPNCWLALVRSREVSESAKAPAKAVEQAWAKSVRNDGLAPSPDSGGLLWNFVPSTELLRRHETRSFGDSRVADRIAAEEMIVNAWPGSYAPASGLRLGMPRAVRLAT